MKGYKHTELGWIPEEWRIKTIGEVSLLINGRAFKQEELLDRGKYLVLRVGNLNTTSKWYYSNLELEDVKYVFKGDLMYAWSASFGPRFWTGEKTIFHYHIWKVVPNDNVEKGFLFYLLDFDKENIINSKQGGTMFHITKGDMESRYVALPPKSEQKYISLVLKTWDHAISTLTQLISAKQQLKKGLMQQLLTGKKRLPGFEGEWEKKNLGELFIRIIGGGTPAKDRKEFWGGDIPWATVKDISNFNPNATQEYISELGLKNSSTNKVPANTLIISTRMAVGKCVMFDMDVAINQDLKALFPDNNYSKLFLYYYFEHSIDKINLLGNGSTVKGLVLNDLKGIQIFLPTEYEEQEAIGNFLQLLDYEVKFLFECLSKIKTQKSALMQQLLTGKKRVKVDPD
ncbi:MAG: restriction endonuclease subunit S [Chitinophagales bacterium]|nr:restriction endonuclease subunit S [Chitinophagales bacterium]